MQTFLIKTPEEFSFELSLSFLLRSPHEVLHRCVDGVVTKAVVIRNMPVLFQIKEDDARGLVVQIQQGAVEASEVEQYIRDWLGLNTDLKPFYALAQKDKLLSPLVKQYFGYRIVGQPDLFESMVWAILGQQINLNFAYTLKKRFVEQYGERVNFNGVDYFLFPRPDVVASIAGEELVPLQFSRQKTKYIIALGEQFASGLMSREKLAGLTLQEAKEHLMKIKGIGNWTANYVLMKTFHYPDAFPLEDAGLHNALRNRLGMNRKPTTDEVKKIFRKYRGWEAYATLYLWKSL